VSREGYQQAAAGGSSRRHDAAPLRKRAGNRAGEQDHWRAASVHRRVKVVMPAGGAEHLCSGEHPWGGVQVQHLLHRSTAFAAPQPVHHLAPCPHACTHNWIDGGVWQGVAGCGRVWQGMAGYGRVWQGVAEGCGRGVQGVHLLPQGSPRWGMSLCNRPSGPVVCLPPRW
jgi:hypothetical protein